jgi:hypothetical protein
MYGVCSCGFFCSVSVYWNHEGTARNRRQFIAIRKVCTYGRLVKDKCHLSYPELIFHLLTHSQTECFVILMNRATSLQRLQFGVWIAWFKASGSVAE